MGFLGAMAGLGQGMQGYAGVMRENQKMNWQAQQDKAKHERQVNLENLRAQNNRQLAQDNRTFQAEQGQLGREHSEAMAEQQHTLGMQRIEKQDELAQDRKVVGKTEEGIDITLGEMEAMTDAERKAVMSPEAYRVQLELNKQEELIKQAKKFTEQEATEKADALQEVLGQDGISPTDELKIFAVRNRLDMKDIIGTSKPMSADMVKAIDGMLSQDEAYVNAGQQQKIQLIRDAHQRLSGGIAADKRALTPEALARAKANPDKLTPEDLQMIPPEQIKEIFEGTGEAPKPNRTPSTNMVQGQQYMRDQVNSMPMTQKIKQGYGALQGRFQELREGK